MPATSGFIQFYKDKNGKHRWRAIARNGKKIADCAEAYNSKAAMLRGARTTAQIFALAYGPKIVRGPA